MNRIGTCSLCGGPVVVPETMINPVPHCTRCGAIARNPQLPILPMEPPMKVQKDPLPHHVIYRGFA